MTTSSKQRNDAVIERIHARGDFILQSAAHFGGGDGIADMSLLGNSIGNPFIPGSSIAGAAQSYLARRLLSWTDFRKGQDKWRTILHLFGYNDPTIKTNTMSPLFVSDAQIVDGRCSTEIRDGVRIENDSGVAADKAKFDYEVVEAGSAFTINLECIIRKNDPIQSLKKEFEFLLTALQNGDIRLGKKTSRGLGHGRVHNWELVSLDMSAPDHVIAWMQGPEAIWNFASGKKAFSGVFLPDKRTYFQIKASCRLKTAIMIRQEESGEHRPDFQHIHSAGKPLTPGSSLSGAIRARTEFIARTLWENDEKAVSLVISDMFGPEQKAGIDNNNCLWKSRLCIEENFIEGGIPEFKDRVAIDRFTGGSLDSAKFNEEPLEPENSGTPFLLEMMLENPQEWEIGLLLSTLKDFWLGHASVGGEASLGRGLLEGVSAELTLYQGDPDQKETWQLKNVDAQPFWLAQGDKQSLDRFLSAATNLDKTKLRETDKSWSRVPESHDSALRQTWEKQL